MEEEYKIKSIESVVHSALFRFLNDVLPFEYNAEIYRWEYSHSQKIFCYIEHTNNKVVGVQGMIPIELRFQSEQLLSAKSETSYLDKSTQGKGLFKKLYNTVIEETKGKEIALIWGFTVLGGLWEKLGFTVKNECLITYSLDMKVNYHSYVQSLPKTNLVKKRISYTKYLYKSYKKSQAFKLNTKQVEKQYGNLIIENKLIRPEDMDELYRSIQDDKMINIQMNQEFINNRISQNPFVNYSSCYIYDENKKLLGYYFLAKNKDSKHGETVFISDVTGINYGIKSLLINLAIKGAKADSSVNKINLFGNSLNPEIKESQEILESYGATKKDSGMYIVYLPLKIGEDKLSDSYDFSNWYINGLWTEGVKQ